MKVSPWIVALAASVTLTACGSDSSAGNGTPSVKSLPGTFLNEAVLGDPNAPVELVEYASITCGHCANFHNNVLPDIKPRIDSGEVKLIFREFPTPPGNIAMAGFQIARCAGEDKYFDVLGDLFENQNGILTAARSGAAREALVAVAGRHGLSAEEFTVCTRDDQLWDSIMETVSAAEQRGVNATPALYLDGEVIPGISVYNADALNGLIDDALGIETESTDTDVSEVEADETPAAETDETVEAETETASDAPQE